LTRRAALATAAAFAVPLAQARPLHHLSQRKLVELERRAGGRLGVCVIDTASGRRVGHRMDERFAMCSTFKLPLAAAILQQADRGKLSLDTVLPYTKADIVMHAPVTEPNLVKGGMTIRDLAEAAQKQSDNVAANLLVKHLGGPQVFTQFLRTHGDRVSRLDRYEPEMNNVPPGDKRDTTSPAAMAETVARILTTGRVLMRGSRQLLMQWMADTATGAKRLRAGLPIAWRSGDKTGTALDDYSAKCNDVAFAAPPDRAFLIIAAYYNTGAPHDELRDEDQAIIAEVGRIAAAWAK
jgi:beta-lactamase class A